MLTWQNYWKIRRGSLNNHPAVMTQREPSVPSSLALQFCRWLGTGNDHGVPAGDHVRGDRLLRYLPVWLDPGVLHPSHGVLDILRGGQHRPDHRQLLLQPVDGLHLGHDGGFRLQGLPVHAGPAW